MVISVKNIFAYFLLSSVIVFLNACGGSTSSGQANTPGIPDAPAAEDDVVPYNGPLPLDDDIAAFKEHLWSNLAKDDSCGQCHNEIGAQEPMFVRRDDINQAYTIALPLVNLEAPVLSRLVTKIKDGHQGFPVSDGGTIEIWIQRWATGAGVEAGAVPLEPPPILDVGESKVLPADSGLFASTVWPLVTDATSANCISCHSQASAQQQQPYFADADVELSYADARTLIDANNPTDSRLYQRMVEGHNVWANPDDATVAPSVYSREEMLEAIEALIAGLGEDATALPDGAIVSHATILPDGTLSSTGVRAQSDAIALYKFDEGGGSLAADISGVEPAMNLNLTPEVEFVGSWGIRIKDNGKAQADTLSSKKLNDRIKLTGEYSIEAWIIPANVSQEESRIINYAGSGETHNFALSQNLYDYDFQARNEATDGNGMPMLSTPSADEVLQATLQHVVATYDPLEGRKLYVNGELISEDQEGGSINNWDDGYIFTVGNEVDNIHPWTGTLRFLAIHNRVLNGEQILGNFDAGVGQKYFLLFGVSHLVANVVPDAYVVFMVEQYDDYSYLFSNPFFISLNEAAVMPASGFLVDGIRLGINGREYPVSQAFANVSTVIDADNYDADNGTPLIGEAGPSGTLVPVENGAASDLFFLTFDALGAANAPVSSGRPAEEVLPPEVQAVSDVVTESDFGLRIFDEIFETMSAITSVPSVMVGDEYRSNLRRSLPAATSTTTFSASQQSAIAQLSLAYCTALVGDTDLRDSVFPGFNFAGGLTSANADLIIDPLMNRMLFNAGLSTQPSIDDPLGLDLEDPDYDPNTVLGVKDELERLIDGLSSDDASTKVIAVCTSVLASAATLLQ